MHSMQGALQKRMIAHSIEHLRPHLYPLAQLESPRAMPTHKQPPWVVVKIGNHCLQLPLARQWTIVVALLPEGV